MIPSLQPLAKCPWEVLPSGVHPATLAEVAGMFGTNARRRDLCDGLLQAAENLAKAGCKRIFIDGSFVTGKPVPGDYDALWDPAGVNKANLDPVFLDFSDKRANQKAKYGGEFFPSDAQGAPGVSFMSFFQTEKNTGKRKGILEIDLTNENFE